MLRTALTARVAQWAAVLTAVIFLNGRLNDGIKTSFVLVLLSSLFSAFHDTQGVKISISDGPIPLTCIIMHI